MSSAIKPWLVLGIIFIVGVVTGVALTIGLAPHFKNQPGSQQLKSLWMAQLVQRLDLTTDQQAKIQPILADARNKLQLLHRDEVDRGSQIFKAAHNQISALLTPGQQVELQKMESEREQLFSDHLRPWGQREGPGGLMRHHGGPGDDGRTPPPANMSTNAPPPGPPPQDH
jgi:Spy/CpxP family protein refolding chaperone